MERVDIQPGNESIVGVSILDEADVIEVGQLLNLMQEVDAQSPYDVKIQVIESYQGSSPTDIAYHFTPEVMEANDIFYLMAEDSTKVEFVTWSNNSSMYDVELAAETGTRMLENGHSHTDVATFLLKDAKAYTVTPQKAPIEGTSTTSIPTDNSPAPLLPVLGYGTLALVGIGLICTVIAYGGEFIDEYRNRRYSKRQEEANERAIADRHEFETRRLEETRRELNTNLMHMEEQIHTVQQESDFASVQHESYDPRVANILITLGKRLLERGYTAQRDEVTLDWKVAIPKIESINTAVLEHRNHLSSFFIRPDGGVISSMDLPKIQAKSSPSKLQKYLDEKLYKAELDKQKKILDKALEVKKAKRENDYSSGHDYRDSYHHMF